MDEKNCKGCIYFLNCTTPEDAKSQECQRFPGVNGFCQLWEGPLMNFEICAGYTLNKK